LKVGSEYFDLVLMALPLKPRPEPSLKGLMLAFCPFLTLQRPRETSAFPSGHQAASCLMSTQPSVMGLMMSSLPSERHAAELMLLSVVNAWPPHHAVRGSGEPI